MSGGTTTLQIKLTTDGQGNVTATLGDVEKKVRDIKPAAQESGGALDNLLSKLEAIKGFMAAWGVYEVVKEVVGAFVEANVEAQKLQATLVGVTGSAQGAAQAYATIQGIAENSISSASQLTDAWVRLANVGITPTQESMQGLANLAAQTGQSVDTVANAVAMAMAGHYRGLQQMGIQAEAVGDKLVVSFQGQTQIIDKSRNSIEAYIASLGQAPAAIAAQAAQVSSLGGQWDQLKKRVGDFFESFTTGTSAVTAFVGESARVLEALNQINQAGGRLAQLAALMKFSQGDLGGFEAMAAAAKASNDAATQAVPTLEQLRDKYESVAASALGLSGGQQQLAGGLSSVLGFLRQLPEQAALAAAAQLKLDDGGKTLAASLEQQANTMGQTAVEAAIYELTLGKLKGASIDVAAAVLAAANDLDAARAKMKASAEFDAAVKSAQQYVETLKNEAATIGMTADQQVLYNAAVQAAKAPTDALRQAILQAAQAKVAAQEAWKRWQDQIKQDDALQKLLEQLNPLAAAGDKAAEEITLLYQAMEHGKISAADYERLVGEVADNYKKAADNADVLGKALEQVRQELDPQAAALAKLKSELDTIEQAYAKGLISMQQYWDLSQKAYAKFGQSLGDSQYAQAFTQLWQQAAGDVSSLFADIFVNGTHDAGAKMMQEMQNLAKQLMDFWIKQKIIIPLQQQMNGQGAGPAGSDMAMGAIAMGGSAVGGAVGGKAGGFITGAASGAVLGAEIGTIFPVIGNILGAVIGGIVGGIMGMVGAAGNKTPSFTIGGASNADPNALYGGKFTDYLGTFGLRGKHITDDMQRQLEGSIASFDNTLAGLIPPELVDSVKTRIQSVNTSFTGSSPDEVEKAHLDAVMGVVAPELQRFVDGLTNVQDRLKAFQSLMKIKDEFDAIASSIVQLSGSPVDKVVDQLAQLDKGVTKAQGDLSAAIKTQDPTQILSAEQALKQAVLNRYNTEIQMVQQLQQALQGLEQQSYSLNMTIAQRIADLGGANTTGDVAFAGLSNTQAQINASADAQTTLNLLQQFTSQVDQWLNAAIAQINAPLEAQIAQLESQKSAIQAQMQYENDVAAAMNAAAQARHQAEIAALQKQLQLAQQWLGVLDHAQQAIEAMMTGSANPLGGFSQLDNFDTIIANLQAKIAGETGTAQAKDADTLIQELQQRLQLIMSGNLYDRSSPEYMAAYNQTLEQLNAVKALAQPEASQVDLLQKQLDALQQTNVAIYTASGQSSYQLSMINQAEENLRKQEQVNADKLNKQALDYYTWAQGVAADAEQKRHDELMDQLKTITGGMDVNAWIAQETSREVDLLNSIDQQLKDFLAAISSGAAATGGNGGSGGTGPGTGVGGGGGGSGGGITPIAPGIPGGSNAAIHVHVTTTINGTGMGAQDIAAAVNAGLNDALPAAVPALKRMLKVA